MQMIIRKVGRAFLDSNTEIVFCSIWDNKCISLSTNQGPRAGCLFLSAQPGSEAAVGGSPDSPAHPESSMVCPGLTQPRRMQLPLPAFHATSFFSSLWNWPHFQRRHLCNRYLMSCENHGEDFFLIASAGYTAKQSLNLSTQSESLDTIIGVCFLL